MKWFYVFIYDGTSEARNYQTVRDITPQEWKASENQGILVDLPNLLIIKVAHGVVIFWRA